MKYEKIAPGLSILLADYEKHGRSGLQKHMRTMGVVSSIENSPKTPRVVSFLYCDNQAEFTDLSAEQYCSESTNGENKNCHISFR